MVLLFIIILQQQFYVPPKVKTIVVEQFSTQEGLGESFARDLVRDQTGFLWVAHGRGISRFDGYRFRTYSEGNDSNISGHEFIRLHLDSQQRLWSITRAGQIHQYNPEEDDFDFKNAVPDSINNLDFFYLETCGADTLLLQYVDSKTRGQLSVSFYRPSDNTIGVMDIPISEKDAETVASVTHTDFVFKGYEVAPDGTEWMSLQAVLLYRPKGESLFRIFYDNKNNYLSFIDSEMLFVGDNTLYITLLGSGVIKINLDDHSWKQFIWEEADKEWPFHRIESLDWSSKYPNQLWIGTRMGSVMSFDLKTHHFERIADVRDQIVSFIQKIYVDDQGILWAGSKGGGIYKINPVALQSTILFGTERVNGYQQKLSVTQIRPFSDSTMFTSTFENGYYLTDLDGKLLYEESRVEKDRYLPQKSVWDGWLDSKTQTIWLATSNGLTLKRDYQKEQESYVHSSLPQQTRFFSRVILGNKSGKIWLGAYNGLHEWEQSGKTWTHYQHKNGEKEGLAHNGIIALLNDSRGRLWVAHNAKGLTVLEYDDKQKAQFHHLRPDDLDARENCIVYQINEIETDVFLISTNRGVYRADGELDGMHKASLHPLIDKAGVNSVHFDERDRYWFGTGNGIYILEEDGNLINLAEADGLPTLEINNSSLKDARGQLWYSTNAGVFKVNSDTISVEGRFHDIKITEFQIIGREKKYIADNTLELTHLEHDFTFSATNFDLRDAPSQMWSYRLRGYSDQWFPATEQNVAQFTNIPPGDYSIDARVESRYGYVQTQASLLSLKIIPAFWQTAWFKGAIASLVAFVIITIVHLRNLRFRKVAEERDRIMGDLHDDLSSVLATVNFNVHTLQADQTLDAKMVRRLQTVSQAAVQTMKNLIWSVDPTKDNWGNLTDAIQSYVNNVLDMGEWRVGWDISGNRKQNIGPEKRKQIFLIIKELIANVLKHSDGDQLTVELHMRDEIRIVFSDNGQGFDPEKVEYGVGIKSIHKRLKLLKASCKMSTNSSTTWHITIP